MKWEVIKAEFVKRKLEHEANRVQLKEMRFQEFLKTCQAADKEMFPGKGNFPRKKKQ